MNSMEFNPGHLDSLRKLGILNADEAAITPDELARRVAKSEKVTEAVSDIRQETQNVVMSLDSIADTLDDIISILPSLTTKDEIEQELAGLANEVEGVVTLAKRVRQIREFNETLRRLCSETGIVLDDATEQHLEVIERLLRQLPVNIDDIAQSLLMKGRNLIEELIRKLDEPEV